MGRNECLIFREMKLMSRTKRLLSCMVAAIFTITSFPQEHTLEVGRFKMWPIVVSSG